MRRLEFDYDEFDPPEGENFLQIAIATRKQCPQLADFLDRCGASTHAGSLATPQWPRWPEIVESLRSRAQFELPPRQECDVTILNYEWNDLEIVICTESTMIWYHGWTTA